MLAVYISHNGANIAITLGTDKLKTQLVDLPAIETQSNCRQQVLLFL